MNQTYRLMEYMKHIQPVPDESSSVAAEKAISALDDICLKHGGVAYNAQPADLTSWSEKPNYRKETFLGESYQVTSSHLIGTYLVTNGVNTKMWIARTQIVPLNCQELPDLVADFTEFYGQEPTVKELGEKDATEEAA